MLCGSFYRWIAAITCWVEAGGSELLHVEWKLLLVGGSYFIFTCGQQLLYEQWKLVQVGRSYSMLNGTYYRCVAAITCGAEANTVQVGLSWSYYMWAGVGYYM